MASSSTATSHIKAAEIEKMKDDLNFVFSNERGPKYFCEKKTTNKFKYGRQPKLFHNFNIHIH